MSMFTRCAGDVTIITRTPDGDYLYAIDGPLAVYTGEVTSLAEALLFALTGSYFDDLGPDDQVPSLTLARD